MLAIHDLHVAYGQSEVLHGLNISVASGEIVAIMGRNGMGKTTLMKSLMGIMPKKSGSITMDGVDVSTMKSYERVAKGLAYVPQGRMIFSTMTVHENLLLGGYLVKDQKLVQERADYAYELMPRLLERRTQQGGTLSGGEQQMLAIGRALVGGPKLLLLDEPSMGLAPLIVKQVMEIIEAVNKQGTTILLVEQNAKAALKIADRAYVLESGRVTLEGPASELAEDSRVIEAYLGA